MQYLNVSTPFHGCTANAKVQMMWRTPQPQVCLRKSFAYFSLRIKETKEQIAIWLAGDS
jgi:hypothetical protein